MLSVFATLSEADREAELYRSLPLSVVSVPAEEDACLPLVRTDGTDRAQMDRRAEKGRKVIVKEKKNKGVGREGEICCLAIKSS